MNKRRVDHIIKTVDSTKPVKYGQLLMLLNHVKQQRDKE